MNNRPLVIYHGNCADGFSGAWCFWKKYGDQADYVAGSYQKPAPDIAGRDVYLVDFSYKRAVVAAMLDAAKSVTLIDHHKTALEDLAALPGLQTFTDLDRSGATLAWDFLFPDQPRPLLLGHIEDRDLWRFRLAGTREVSSFVFSHDYTFDRWDKLMSSDQAELLRMTAAGAAIERKHRKDVADIVRTCKRRMTIAGYDVPVASIPYTMASDAGGLMAEGEPFSACYYDTPEGRKFSLRSTDVGVDVAAIAEQFGGGGHEHAAGFTVPADHALATHSCLISAEASRDAAMLDQHHRDSAELRRLCAARDEARNTVASLRDMLDDARAEFTAVVKALGVPYEPHQTLLERTLQSARSAVSPSTADERAAPVPARHAAALRRAMDLLDRKLGDTDPNTEGLDEEEIERTYPVFAAMRIIVALHDEASQDAAPAAARQTSTDPWIVVSDRLPAPLEWVLAHNGKWTGKAAFFPGNDVRECWQDEHREFVELLGPAVTHWMALPAAPGDAPAEAREPDGQHSDDAAIDAFAAEMKAKMAASRAKGRSGWETCPPADLSRMLREHVAKGDPIDVANFCMMLSRLYSPISTPADAGEAVLSPLRVTEIMEQAQVFASAWSLVGGVFDHGDALETAEQEKQNLRDLVSGALGSRGGKA